MKSFGTRQLNALKIRISTRYSTILRYEYAEPALRAGEIGGCLERYAVALGLGRHFKWAAKIAFDDFCFFFCTSNTSVG